MNFPLANCPFDYEQAPPLLHRYRVWKTSYKFCYSMRARAFGNQPAYIKKQFHQTLLFQQRSMVCKRGCRSHQIFNTYRSLHKSKVQGWSLLQRSSCYHHLVWGIRQAHLWDWKYWEKFSETANGMSQLIN